MITAVIFDFDGTLIDSDEVKDTAYHLLFPDVPPELIDKARAPEEAKARRGEGSRETIIRAILERLSEEGLFKGELEQELPKYLEKYSSNVKELLVSVPEIPGAKTMLKALHGNMLLFLNSGTPDQYLTDILESRDLRVFFTKTYGCSTGNKIENTKKIVEEHVLDPSNVVFVGNNEADKECATALGLHFIPVMSAHSDFKMHYEHELTDLADLPRLLERL
jgi:phosphoglycolate phosphatase-like HAD superfamily hydrolase